ncbi:hypothetical protein BJ878DRAFT_563603 [Calycina marina]|uniref:Protein transport protein SEC31 n=1 Tax=Calycina marina TaxID=1763456 RepID=A0A9P8CJ23_9HELO|nr:hypothetical protein BJ878DRAFT_563603 [Calycina marina]
MVRLREIQRTAAFAFSPGSGAPLIVTGTKAGAVDADFSDETKLEIWDLSLDNEQVVELQPKYTISTDSRFHDIAWAPASADHPRGIIAGALENGFLDLWDAEKLLNGDADALMSRTTSHTGAIKSLQFNPSRSNLLATAGAKGELFIHSIDGNEVQSNRLGTAAARPDDLECVAWNRKLAHILATGGSGGFVTVWDLRTKKASVTLNNNRKPVSAIAWDPNNATKLLTATPDDTKPVVLLWDLRNSNAPERTLEGHLQGILSLSWCEQDNELLLSCGKDNKTIVWNPQTGEQLGEFPEVTNWTFQVGFNPHNPSLSATASFDGKISVQTLQNTNPKAAQSSANVDEEDFFTKAQTQPQQASFSLKKAPKWLGRPAGASFGFGGKLVSYSVVAGEPRSSKVRISIFSVDSDVGTTTETFEKALVLGDVKSICESHVADAKTDEEKADWQVIEALIAEQPREHVKEYLGFFGADELADLKLEDKSNDASVTDGSTTAKNNRLSAMFSDGVDSDDFLSSIAATKGTKTDDPFHLLAESDSAAEKQITKALLLGQFEKAMTLCLKEDRIADAFIIANCGGKDLFEKAQTAYLSKKSQGPNYLRLLSSVIEKNLWDVVHNADLSNWKEAMATLCTFADPTEFPDLCEALGDRIVETGLAKDASFCYLVGSKLEKVITIWIEELQESEKAAINNSTGDSTYSVHARSLQNFIEKVTIFRDVTKFQDSEKNLTSGWKLAPLYDKYTEYAEIVAAHGQLSIAARYLDLLPTQYPAAEVARNRVKLASRTDSQPIQSQLSTGGRNSARPQRSGYQPPASTQPAMNSFIPPASTPAANPYAPAGGYQPQQHPRQQQYGQYQAPQSSGPGASAYMPPPQNFAAPLQNFAAPPPRNTTSSMAPAATRSLGKDLDNWNDTPMVTNVAPGRRTGTPLGQGQAKPPAQYQNSYQNPSIPPPGGPSFARATPPPPAPPPKGPAPARVNSPLAGPPSTFQQPPRPSSAANLYSPVNASPAGAPYAQLAQPPTIPRGASPYNAPPAAAPPTSRYAPSPAAQQLYSQPPPPQAQAPPSNPYAPQAQYNQQPQGGPPLGPSQLQGTPQGPPQGPPRGFQNQSGPSSNAATSPPPRVAAPPAKARHPAGDRNHIPASAQRLVDIFTGDMQRVASKAPASFARQVEDTQKRLNILFDHLNNEELVKPDTIQRLAELAEALQAKNFDIASQMQGDIMREKADECGSWMVGVKRLISMSKVTA